MSFSLLNKIEQVSYAILFDLENELGIQIEQLPGVYYVYEKFSFNGVGLNVKEYSGIKQLKVKNKKIGAYLPDKKIILVNSFRKDILGEEMGHFIHHNFIGNFESIVNDFGARARGEMVGYFCSKLIEPKRKSGYKEDNFKNKTLEEEIYHLAYIIKKDGYDDLIHQQGYLLGEKLYNQYISRKIKMKEIRKIIKDPLVGHNKAFIEFLNLRDRFL